jgi:hypothetical protein
MTPSIKAPLAIGGVLFIVWIGLGPATVMQLGAHGTERWPHWRQAYANVMAYFLLAYMPLYFVVLVTAPLLKWRHCDRLAFVVSLTPLMLVVSLALLMLVFFFIPVFV